MPISLPRLLPLLLAGGVLAAPAAAQTPALRVPVTMDTLPNGLRLIVHEDRSAPVVTVNVWYHVGSGDEKPGRTGFAHLFEHLMFMGSQHAPYPMFDRALEAAGANNNGSTTTDRTNYFEAGPRSALPLMLWLEADRMANLLPPMDQQKLDLQRDVVKNERRQNYENQPYGLAFETLTTMVYPATHPYGWQTIGSMADLSAASIEDVKDFFRQWYAPNNAVITVAGDVQADSVKRLVTRWFGAIPRGPAITRATPAPVSIPRDTLAVLEDRVSLPRLYHAWITPRNFGTDDATLDLVAYLLAGARNARLTRPLVYEQELAASVNAFQNGRKLDGNFLVIATARPGKTLAQVQAVIDRELRRLADEGPTPRELEQAKNATEAQFLGRLERVNDKADQLNGYYFFTGQPDGFAADLARYRTVTAADIQRAVKTYLLAPKAVLSIVPQGKRELAVTAGGAR